MQEENFYLKVLAVEEQIAYQGVQWSEFNRNSMSCLFSLGILMSCFFSLRILMSWDIEFLQNYDPYNPWYHNIINIFQHSRLFFVLYLLVNTVIAIVTARKAVECISIIIFLLLEKTRVIFQVSMTLIKNNIIWKYLAKKM